MSCFITPRMKLIASKVKEGAAVVDVGTDHAYIPIYLIENRIIDRAIVTDINKGPLKRAEENILAYGQGGRIKAVLSDGLSAVPRDEYDTVIIAGMGGILISRIIDRADLDDGKLLILQPMTAAAELRLYLYSNGYGILDEELVSEGEKLYNVLVAQRGKAEPFEERDLYIGKRLVEKNDALLPVLISKQIKFFETKINGLAKSNNDDKQSVDCLRELLVKLKKML